MIVKVGVIYDHRTYEYRGVSFDERFEEPLRIVIGELDFVGEPREYDASTELGVGRAALHLHNVNLTAVLLNSGRITRQQIETD